MAWIAEKLLTAIRESGMRECVTEARLVEITGLTETQVARAAITLRRNDLLEKTGMGCHKLTSAGLEALAGANVHSGPRGKQQSGKRIFKDTLRIRVWRAIRIRRKFTVPELIVLVADENSRGDITSNVQKYVRALAKAGYLIEMPKREQGTALTSNGYKRFWLQDAKDTGPKAPVWRLELKTVYDPNTETEVAI
jgi:hypothetical protein